MVLFFSLFYFDAYFNRNPSFYAKICYIFYMSFLQLLSVSVLCNVFANVLLKTGITKVGGITLTKATLVSDFSKVVFSPLIIIGLGLYGVSFVLWLRVLSFNDLSRVYPIFVTLVFLLTTVGSARFLGESI